MGCMSPPYLKSLITNNAHPELCGGPANSVVLALRHGRQRTSLPREKLHIWFHKGEIIVTLMNKPLFPVFERTSPHVPQSIKTLSAVTLTLRLRTSGNRIADAIHS